MGIEAYKTKTGQRYLATLYQDGKRVARQGGFATKREAKTWLAEQTVNPPYPILTASCHEWAGKYLDWVKPRRGPNTYIAKRGVLKRLLHQYPDLLLAKIDRAFLTSYHQSVTNSDGAKTANRHLLEISIWLNWLIREDVIQSNPARAIERAREDRKPRAVPTAEEMAAIRLAATPAERELIDALYFTGARLSEILSLTWEDVNFDLETIRLWTSKRRGGNREPRVLPMHPHLSGIIKRRWETRPDGSPMVFTNGGRKWSRNHPFIRDLVKRLCARAGVPTYTAHCIRHHVATLMVDTGKANARQIQRFLGHMNLKTTEIYLHDLTVDRGVLEAFPIGDSIGDCSPIRTKITNGGTN
jgi:integrase